MYLSYLEEKVFQFFSTFEKGGAKFNSIYRPYLAPPFSKVDLLKIYIYFQMLERKIKLNSRQPTILKVNVDLNLILFISRGSRENKIKYLYT